MGLKQQLVDEMKTAMRAGDKPRLGVIRLALAAIKQQEVDQRIELDEGQVLAVLEKMLKQRRDSATQYTDAGREDLASQENFEIGVIETWMPRQLEPAELEALIDATIRETGAESMRDMGKVMALVKQRAAGQADMAQVSAQVKARLG